MSVRVGTHRPQLGIGLERRWDGEVRRGLAEREAFNFLGSRGCFLGQE